MSDYLCEELLIEIFTRLPPKSLLRCRSLSKAWYSCIGSPGFIDMHTSRSTQKLLFRHELYYQDAYGPEYLETLISNGFSTLHSEDLLPLCPKSGYNGITATQFPCNKIFKIVGSCNGILCLTELEKKITLWNPSIRRKLSVPGCPRTSTFAWEGIGIGLGFGFDPISNDYIIVQIYSARETSFFYSLKTRTWRAIASPTPLISRVLAWSCFVNGALHWVVDRYHSESHETDLHCILKFDLSTHVFGMIPLLKPLWKVRVITTIKGSLAVISTDHNNKDSRIWVRKDDSWSLVFKSKANELIGAILMGVLQPTTSEDLLLGYMMERIQVHVNNMGVQSRLVQFHAASFILEVVHYVESLHLLDMETTCDANQLSVFAENKTGQLSVSDGKKTSKLGFLSYLFYYFQIPFKLLFNMTRRVNG